MTDEAPVVEEDAAQSPLVTLSFQRDENRKQKYLEAEPKALGITQIGFSLFNIICAGVFLNKHVSELSIQIPIFISSLLVATAGSLAIAAQNLHLPTLRACFGMQIVACGASFTNMICSLVNIVHSVSVCYMSGYGWEKSCNQIWDTQVHFYSESAIIQVALLTISVTLAAYCGKVVNCCAPAPKLPVITVQAPVPNNQQTGGKEAVQKSDVVTEMCGQNL